MTQLLLWGCMLLAYGPPAVFFLLYVARRSALLLACLAAALFLLFSLLAASALWWMVPPLRTSPSFPLITSSLLAEVFRYALLLLYVRADGAVERLGRPLKPRLLNDLAGSLAMGLGYGLMASIMGAAPLLALAGGDAAWYRLPQCPGLNAHALTAATQLLLTALHLATMPLALDALRRWRTARASGAPGPAAALRVLAPCAFHTCFSLCGLLTAAGAPRNACAALLPLQAGLCIAAGAVAASAVRRADYAGRRQVKAWEALAERLREEMQRERAQ